jgi:hypothetical protein
MAVADVAKDMTNLCRQGKLDEAAAKYYSQDIVSIEAHGENRQVQGMDAIRKKSEWWDENFEVNGIDVVGPFINGNDFSVNFKFETINKKNGERMMMEEIAVYTVRDDKIVEERFFDKAS